MLRVEEYRRKKGLSIRQLSINTGVSRTYITEIESGKYDNPGIKIICALCRELEVTPNDLIPEKMYK